MVKKILSNSKMKGEIFVDKIVFPKIKFDTGGTPIEYTVEQVSFEELLRSPEDVYNENEIKKEYVGGINGIKIKPRPDRKRF